MKPPRSDGPSAKPGTDLSITALYTCETWAWGRLEGAELLASVESRRVFRVTNFALALARLFRRDFAPLPHSLLQRHTAIDRLLALEEPAEVLELASGLSRRGVALSRNAALTYTEVDLAPVVAQKRALLSRTDEGRAALARPNLHLVEGDVIEIALRPRSRGTLAIIAEGLFMYLAPATQRSLLDKIHALLRDRPGFFVFDLVPASEQPKPGLIGRVLAWLMKRFTKGRTFERDARTRGDWIEMLHDAGFSKVDPLVPREVAHAWSLPFPDSPTQQLLFVCRP